MPLEPDKTISCQLTCTDTHRYEYMESTISLERDMRDKLAELPPDEFEGVLHPVFQEDEMTLILVGAFLGLVVGGLQVLAYPS